MGQWAWPKVKTVQNHGFSSLSLKHNSTYGQMFTTALKKYGQLSVGLYRLHDQDNPDSVKRYVITNPPAELRIRVTDTVGGGV